MNVVMNKSKRFYSALIFLVSMLVLCLVAFGDVKPDLQIKVADKNDNSIWHDVKDLMQPRQDDFDIYQNPSKQIEVAVRFDTGYDAARELEIVVPQGLIITEMSAKQGWSTDGIRTLSFSDEEASVVESVNITAADGTPWVDQRVLDGSYTDNANPLKGKYYTPYPSTSATRIIGDGKIKYVFNKNCSEALITVTFIINTEILPHDATNSVTLEPITAKRVFDGTTMDEELTLTITSLAIGRLNNGLSSHVGGGTRSIPANDDGAIPMFVTGHAYRFNISGDFYKQNHWIQTGKYSTTYPAEATFQGFSDRMIYRSDNSNLLPLVAASEFTAIDANTYEYLATAAVSGPGANPASADNRIGHLVVTHTLSTRTVTFEYYNVFAHDDSGGGSFWCYWTAEIDPADFDTPKQLAFTGNWQENSGLLIGQDASSSNSPTSSILVTPTKDPGFSVTATGIDRTRRDLNDYADGEYPYDQLLGSFTIVNTAPSNLLTPLKYEFEFDECLQVRGLTLPAGAGNNFSNLSITTNKESRAIPGKFNSENGANTVGISGIMFDYLDLGLADDEYLISLSIDQSGLVSVNFNSLYVQSATNYFGRWAEGTSPGDVGKVTVNIYDLSMPGTTDTSPKSTAISTSTVVNWDDVGVAGAGTATLEMYDKVGNKNVTGSFNPSEQIKFVSRHTTSQAILQSPYPYQHIGDIVDPYIYICLPQGISLNNSDPVQGCSVSGASSSTSDWFDLKKVDDYMKTNASGTVWHIYVYTSENKLDMVALQSNSRLSAALRPTGYNYMEVRFTADISYICPTYAELHAEDIVLWDLGKTASSLVTSDRACTLQDTRDFTEKGTEYVIVAPTGVPLNIVQQTGLDVYLGIRAYGSAKPFYTYNGSDTFIAPVSVSIPAELEIHYVNTSSTAFVEGSEIYLPIPKKGDGFDKYFNNKEIIDPVNNDDHASPKWSSYLHAPTTSGTDVVTLEGFDTFYLVDAAGTYYTTNANPVNDDWAPLTALPSDWKIAAAMSATDWAKVTMIKFVANRVILPGDDYSATLILGVDEDAVLGEVNYWRTYQKGWRDEEGIGTWRYGAVVAAKASKAGVAGMIFVENRNPDGIMNASEIGYTNTGEITAVLTADNGMSPINLTMSADGTFKSLDDEDIQYFLDDGTYTVTFTNDTAGYFFTAPTPDTHSNGTNWYMDIEQDDIEIDHKTATYTFKVDSTSDIPAERTTSTEYIGIGLRVGSYRLAYDLNNVNAEWVTDVSVSAETNAYGAVIVDTNSYVANTTTGTPTLTGYIFVGWCYDEEGMNLVGNNDIINGDITLYAKWKANDAVDVIYILLGSVVHDTDVVSYDSMIDEAPTDPTRAGYVFKGWFTGKDGSGTEWVFDNEVGTIVNVDNGVDADDLKLTLYANWQKIVVSNVTVIGSYATVSGSNAYESGATVNIDAGTRSGYTFIGWTISDASVILDDTNSSATSFVMPGKAISVTANWQSTGGTVGAPTAPNTPVPPAAPVKPKK